MVIWTIDSASDAGPRWFSHLGCVIAAITLPCRMHCKPHQIKSDKLFCDSHPWCDWDVCTPSIKLLKLISQSFYSPKATNPYHFVSHPFFLYCLQQWWKQQEKLQLRPCVDFWAAVNHLVPDSNMKSLSPVPKTLKRSTEFIQDELDSFACRQAVWAHLFPLPVSRVHFLLAEKYSGGEFYSATEKPSVKSGSLHTPARLQKADQLCRLTQIEQVQYLWKRKPDTALELFLYSHNWHNF